MKLKKAQGLPINVVVMMILGIIIFALGMGLFSNIYESGDNQLSELRNQVINDIAALECDGDTWICTPSYKLKNGDTQTMQVYIANHGDSASTFKISMDTSIDSGKDFINSDNCGSLNIVYLKNFDLEVDSGNSAQIPFIVKATRVTDPPCSFISTVYLNDSTTGLEIDRTSVIIRVE